MTRRSPEAGVDIELFGFSAGIDFWSMTSMLSTNLGEEQEHLPS